MDAGLPPPLDQIAALCEEGRLEEAEAICRRALEAAPRDAEALHLLGLIALQCGDPNEAVRLINEAVTAAPGQVKFGINLSAVLGQTGRNDEALATARQVVARHPDIPEGHNNPWGAAMRRSLTTTAPLRCARTTMRRSITSGSRCRRWGVSTKPLQATGRR
jgi:Flp pilus assembly protein TadD